MKIGPMCTQALSGGITAFLVTVVVASFANAQTPDTNQTESVEQLIEQLGAAKYKQRQAASKALWQQGLPAIPRLEKAAKNEDPEISIRAGKILEKLSKGEIFGLSDELKKLAKEFREGNKYERYKVFPKLMAAEGGGDLAPFLLEQLTEGDSRLEIIKGASSALGTLARKQNLDGHFERAEQILRMRVEAQAIASEADLAVFLALTAPDTACKIPAVEARRLRILGRNDEALAAARNIDTLKGLQDSILIERGQWRELAAAKEKDFNALNVQSLGVRAAYHRLAGDTNATAEALDDIRGYEKNRKSEWHPVEVLMLNDHFVEGTKLSLAQDDPQAAVLAFQQSDYQAVLDLGKRLPEDKVVQGLVKRIKGPHEKWTRTIPAPPPPVPGKPVAVVPETTDKVVRRLLVADTDEDLLRAKLYALADTSGWHRGIRYETKGTIPEKRLVQANDWTTKIGIHDHWGLMDSLRQAHFGKAMADGNYAEAEHLMERHRLPLHSSTFNYNKRSNYLKMSFDLFRARILRAVDEDRREDIPALLDQFQPLFPNYFDEEEAIEFTEKGHADVVAMVFDRTYKFLQPKLAQFPDSAELHNKFAWQVSLSKARLDEGLAASERSLELSPENPMYLDTKAELLFQMKRDKEALAAMDRALKQDPDNEYYERQIERMKAGKRSSYPK